MKLKLSPQKAPTIFLFIRQKNSIIFPMTSKNEKMFNSLFHFLIQKVSDQHNKNKKTHTVNKSDTYNSYFQNWLVTFTLVLLCLHKSWWVSELIVITKSSVCISLSITHKIQSISLHQHIISKKSSNLTITVWQTILEYNRWLNKFIEK